MRRLPSDEATGDTHRRANEVKRKTIYTEWRYSSSHSKLQHYIKVRGKVSLLPFTLWREAL